MLVVLIDDLGFAGTSSFGGPVPTPTFDQLANEGLTYNNFHTTAVCSPTRTALKSGRNHHVPKEWIARQKGRFDLGWDKLREQILARQIELGVVPEGTGLAPKPAAIPDWSTPSAIPANSTTP